MGREDVELPGGGIARHDLCGKRNSAGDREAGKGKEEMEREGKKEI